MGVRVLERNIVGWAVVLLLTATPSSVPGAEPESPPSKWKYQPVVVDVIVTDRKGHHVAGLTAHDFKIFEDNVGIKTNGVPEAFSSCTAAVAADDTVGAFLSLGRDTVRY